MKKLGFLVTIIALVLSLDFLGYRIDKFLKSSDSYIIKRKIRKTERKIDEVDSKIKEDSENVNEVEKNNEDKVRMLEVWKKELEKTKH